MEAKTTMVEYIQVRMTREEADSVVATIKAGVDSMCQHMDEFTKTGCTQVAEEFAKEVDKLLGGKTYTTYPCSPPPWSAPQPPYQPPMGPPHPVDAHYPERSDDASNQER